MFLVHANKVLCMYLWLLLSKMAIISLEVIPCLVHKALRILHLVHYLRNYLKALPFLPSSSGIIFNIFNCWKMRLLSCKCSFK